MIVLEIYSCLQRRVAGEEKYGDFFIEFSVRGINTQTLEDIGSILEVFV
jgi:hypothetical protein